MTNASPNSPRAAWTFAALLAALAPPLAWFAQGALGVGLAWGGWEQALIVLVLAPLVEEWVFRSLLQASIAPRLARRWPSGAARAAHGANLLASLLFVAAHWPGRGVWALWWAFPSLALGETWRRGERLLPCVLLHAWFNACLLGATQINKTGF